MVDEWNQANEEESKARQAARAVPRAAADPDAASQVTYRKFEHNPLYIVANIQITRYRLSCVEGFQGQLLVARL